MAAPSSIQHFAVPATHATFHDKLNSRWHERALQGFMIIVLGHWAEHLAQAWQIYVMGWPRPKAGGVLGLFYPWLVRTEALHYSYALVMLIGLWVLRKGFVGAGRKWWTIALGIQFWHHIEHALLLSQVIIHHNYWGSPVPVSVLQLFFPRVELHLFYNTVVFVPMVIGMYYHMFPPAEETVRPTCTCVWHREPKVEAAAA
jgi:hypothetical protein